MELIYIFSTVDRVNFLYENISFLVFLDFTIIVFEI